VPEPDPADPPKSVFTRVIETTPVVLTVVATVFAGLSSSELNLAMYWRSVAAQDQAKANDQWALAGFKRDRSLTAEGVAATLRALTGFATPPAPPAGSTDAERLAADWMTGKAEPTGKLPPVTDPAIRAVLDAVRDHQPEAELQQLARGVDFARLDHLIGDSQDEIARLDHLWEPVLEAVEQAASTAGPGEAGGRAAQRFGVEARRYRAESRLNQGLGFLYEVRVKVSSAVAERHRAKSKNFFYVMLVAQAGVTVSALANARRKKNLFWSLASAAGLIAVIAGVYVYLAL
jgi:hypothetical protein